MKQVVLIMVDTQRRDMVGCYPEAVADTPNLKRLAGDGVAFTKAYTCSPVCGPARSAIFTGLFPHTNGVIANGMPLGKTVKNAGEWLAGKGIACGYIGKWHLDGGDYFGYGKCPEGYQPAYWYDMKNYLDSLEDDNARQLSRVNMFMRTDDPKEEDTYAHRCCDRAMAFLDEYKNKEFFLTLSLDEPHGPCVCPRRFVDALNKKKFKIKKYPNYKAPLKCKPKSHRVWGKKYRKMKYTAYSFGQKAFFACNEFCDYEIGRVLDKIRSLGISPMIIYTADHGDMMLSHQLVGKGCAMYNEITNVPLIIAGESVGDAERPVSHIDLLPTVMRYFGVPIPKILHGKPLQDESAPPHDISIEYTRYEVDHDGFMGYQPIRCIYDGHYKLVINLLSSDELYDLEADPYEIDNRILDPACRKTRDELHDRLLEHMNDTRDVYRGYYWRCRPWRKGEKPTYDDTGMTRQPEEEDYVQLDYDTGLPIKKAVRKK